MANPVKKTTKKPAISKPDVSPDIEEEYELMPHKEIVELRQELRKLKSLPPEAGRHTEASFEELTKRMDRLLEVFEEAEKTIKIEEGAATFKEKMAPIVEKMNMILKQNSEIAEGIVALADIMNETKDKLEVGVIYKAKEAEKIKTEPIPRSAPMSHPMTGLPSPGPGPGPMPPGLLPPKPMGAVPTGAPMPPPLPRSGVPMPPIPGAAPMPGPMPPPPGASAAPKKKGLFRR